MFYHPSDTHSQNLLRDRKGLEPPTDSADYTQTFKITKPYLGYLDILYIDADFRVTKGNKNTIVVVERLKEEE